MSNAITLDDHSVYISQSNYPAAFTWYMDTEYWFFNIERQDGRKIFFEITDMDVS